MATHPAADPALEALWKQVIERWEDDSAHRAFVDYCEKSDKLVEAAVRYRGMAGDRERGDAARKRLGAIAVLAMAKLETLRSPDRRASSRTTGYVVVLMFIVASIGLLAYLQSSAH